MRETLSLFATPVRRARLDDSKALNDEINEAIRLFAKEDRAGRAWSAQNAYPGYTSYGSLDDLPLRAPCFAALKKFLDREVAAFAKDLFYDLGGKRLKLDNLWVNMLDPGGFHAGHIHPHSVISGTYYVRVPDGASSLKFEDPRHPMMMAAPMRRADAPEAVQPFFYLAPEEGALLLWESWLRHEVVRNGAKRARLSVSFNYRWG